MIVYLPPGYTTSGHRRYPVLYLLHGARGQFDSSAPEYKIFVGDHDFLKPTIDIYHRRLSRMDCPHDYIVLPGAHQWVMWRVAYADYLEGLFR